jgi:hypothetical protein
MAANDAGLSAWGFCTGRIVAAGDSRLSFAHGRPHCPSHTPELHVFTGFLPMP